MKRLLTSIVILLLTVSVQAQSPSWQYAYGAGACGRDGAEAMCADAYGNLYVAGIFGSDSITFGTFTLYNPHPGPSDIFVVKYDANHNVVWAKSAGGDFFERVHSIDTDAEGCVYITGSYWSSSVIFGTDTLRGGTELDVYLVKYDPNGNVLWARSAGGESTEDAVSVATDHLGYTCISGYYYSDSITFGNITLVNTNYPNNFSTDFFVVKYDPNGNVMWAKSAAGNDLDWVHTVAFDPAGNIIAAGWYSSDTLDFGSYIFTNGSFYNMFILKYDPNGNLVWAQGGGGSDYELIHSIITDNTGNIYATGMYSSFSLSLGPYTFINPDPGNSDMFLVKYDPLGNVVWATTIAYSSSQSGDEVTLDAQNNIYVTGSYWYPEMVIGQDTLTNSGIYYEDVFVVKYDPNGNLIWHEHAGGPGWEWPNGIAVVPSGDVYVAGYFASDTITFDSIALYNCDTNNYYSHDVFIAKLSQPPTGLENISMTAKIRVFPNPASDKVTIEINNREMGLLLLRSITGNIVKQEEPGALTSS